MCLSVTWWDVVWISVANLTVYLSSKKIYHTFITELLRENTFSNMYKLVLQQQGKRSIWGKSHWVRVGAGVGKNCKTPYVRATQDGCSLALCSSPARPGPASPTPCAYDWPSCPVSPTPYAHNWPSCPASPTPYAYDWPSCPASPTPYA